MVFLCHFVVEQEMFLSNIPVTYTEHRRIVALQQSSAKKLCKILHPHLNCILEPRHQQCIMYHDETKHLTNCHSFLFNACRLLYNFSCWNAWSIAGGPWSMVVFGFDGSPSTSSPHCCFPLRWWLSWVVLPSWSQQVSLPMASCNLAKKRYQNGGSMIFNVVHVDFFKVFV